MAFYQRTVTPQVVAMVGLPARGKSYMATKLCRYLRWLGLNVRLFNLGDYRRRHASISSATHDFFRSDNEYALSIRDQIALQALEDLDDWIIKGGQVAFFDATNSTQARRNTIHHKIVEERQYMLFFVESLCDDPDILDRNIKEVKLTGPDYQGFEPDKAYEDFMYRIGHYEKQYQTLTEDHLSYMQIYNVGKRIVVHNETGPVQKRIVRFLMHLNITPRTVYLTRPGESINNVQAILGGDSDLTAGGQEYSKCLSDFVSEKNLSDLRIWTSSKEAAKQTVAQCPGSHKEYKALDDIHAGICEGQTYTEIYTNHCAQYIDTRADKFYNRWPQGECYKDVLTRLELIILKIEHSKSNLLIVSHPAVLRCLLGYFQEEPPDRFAYNINPKLQVERSNVSQYLLGIAEKVAISEEVINIYDNVDLLNGSGGKVKSILAMPIRNKLYKVTGVATIINKNSGLPFDEFDQELFEAFTIFCGLGINNTIMYSEVEKAMTRQKVSLEVLSDLGHFSKRVPEFTSLIISFVFLPQERPVPEAEHLNLYSLEFNDFSLQPDETILAAVRMFEELQLTSEFNIRRLVLYKFLVTIKRNYRQVPYHNWWHAFNVTQMMFSILINCEMTNTFSDLEVLGMIVGCLCHDLDHRGTNNEFQKIAGSNLAQLYGTTSTLEYHHFNQAVMILNSEDHNILSSLSSEEYSIVMNALKNSILATDLSTYFGNRSQFFMLVETKTYSWSTEEHRDILRSILMTSADIAASTKPWHIQYKISLLVKDEFFNQGDMERNELKLQPKAMMDRTKSHEWPLMQYKWMNDVCYPLYDALSNMNPKFEILRKGVLINKEEWRKLYEQSNTSNTDGIEEAVK
ncbi:hypothetical protein M8J75_002082 [Diaphorina citri]|nr:hypothetical protein M8J75_002082 [Diaphorina citri]